MKEIVVINSVGGAGKTSIAASLAALSGNAVIVDCNPDSEDLSIVLSSDLKESHELSYGHKAVIRPEDCIGCGACLAHCRFGAIHRWDGLNEGFLTTRVKSDCENCDYCERSCSVRTNFLIQEMKEAMGQTQMEAFAIDPLACEGCGVCIEFCPVKAIDLQDCIYGEWMMSETRFGPMVHGKQKGAFENPDKLVSIVRQQAHSIAEEKNIPFIITNGPSGIGSPLLASFKGADMVMVITEPTNSGLHDFKILLGLIKQMGIKAVVIVNKWDVNENITNQTEEFARENGVLPIGRISYDKAIPQAIINKTTVVEIATSKIAVEINEIWGKIEKLLID